MNEIHSKKVVHCDLAARNVLLQQKDEKFIAKISDFGLSRMINSFCQFREDTRVDQIRMPPEYFSERKYYFQSDCWMFGLLIYQVCTNKKPYYQLVNTDFKSYILDKNIVQQPTNECSDELWQIIKSCVSFEHKNRPSFEELHKKLLGLSNSDAYGSSHDIVPNVTVAIRPGYGSPPGVSNNKLENTDV